MHEKSTLDFKSKDMMLLKERQLDIKMEGQTTRMVFTLEEVFDRCKWNDVKIELIKGD